MHHVERNGCGFFIEYLLIFSVENSDHRKWIWRKTAFFTDACNCWISDFVVPITTSKWLRALHHCCPLNLQDVAVIAPVSSFLRERQVLWETDSMFCSRKENFTAIHCLYFSIYKTNKTQIPSVGKFLHPTYNSCLCSPLSAQRNTVQLDICCWKIIATKKWKYSFFKLHFISSWVVSA